MVSCLAISDTHCHSLKEIVGNQTADILGIVGDLTWNGTLVELMEFERYLTQIRSQFEVVVYVSGNHDRGMENTRIGYEIAKRTDTIYLCDEAFTYKGIRIYGSPYSSEFGVGWAFQAPKNTKRWYNLPPADIYMFHGPAYGFHDTLQGTDIHVGDENLAKVLLKMNPKPRYVCSGHIHANKGIIEHNGIKFVGCSAVNERYQIDSSGVFFTI
jgi:Icc-related predicted phosphoesterase